MGLLYRAEHSDRWILSVVMVILVPPCGCVSLLCLALAQRSRRNCGGDTATAARLEWISYTADAVAFCFLLAANFYAQQLYRTRLLYLTSSNCSANGRNGTSWSPSVASLTSQSPANMDDSVIKQRFALNNKSVLQSSVDLSAVLRRYVHVLPMSHHQTQSQTDSLFASNEP